MSRYYKLCVIATGITEEQLNKVCTEESGWDGSVSSWKGTVSFGGEGSLYGGWSEEDAHNDIYNALKEINPEAKIRTQWTCMEDLPYEEYGDDID